MAATSYSTVIVDDQKDCIDRIVDLLESKNDFRIEGVAYDAFAGRELILTQRPDLLFLDVEMPQQTGLEMLSQIAGAVNWNMQVVFCTAWEKYLIDALRASAFDFLLKPFTDDQFDQLLERFLRKRAEKPVSFQQDFSNLYPAGKRFMVPTITGFQFLRTDDIGYFEYNGLKKTWTLFGTDQHKIQLRRGIKSTDLLANSQLFVQISQRHIVNIDFLSHINHTECMLFPPFNEQHLPVSRKFQKELFSRFHTL